MGGLLPPAERRSSALLAAYAALSLLLLVVGEHLPTAALRGVGAFVFAPLDRVVLAADRAVAAWRENRRLHARIAELEIENIRLRIAGVENDELRRQMALPEIRSLPLKPVEVLAMSGEPPSAVILSAGRRQGIEAGDVVVTPEGLMGRVVEVYGSQSRAILLTASESAVACEIAGSGVLGVLAYTETPGPRLKLTGVPLADTVRVGQQVLTSGMSRHFPRGLRVGLIRRVGVERDGLTQDLEVAPAVSPSRLRHGFVIPRPLPLEGEP